MMGEARRLARDYAALAGGELFSKIVGFAAFAWLARRLGPATYGAVELAVALAMVFGLVVDFGLGPIGAREVARDRSRSDGLAAGIPALRTLLAIPAVAGFVFAGWLLGALGTAPGLVLGFGASLLAFPWVLNWLFQGWDRMRWVAGAQALRMSVFLVAVVLLVHGPHDLARVGAAECMALAALALYYLAGSRLVLGMAPRLRFEGGRLRALLREGAPVGVSQLLWALNQYLPTLLVATLASGSELAFFGAGHRIVLSTNAFVWLYFFNLYPSLVRTTAGRGAELETLARHSFRATAWIGILGALVGSLLAVPFCRTIYGTRFAPAGEAFAWLVWTLPIHTLSFHARFVLIASGNQSQELVAQAAGVALTALVGALAVPAWGARGGALAMLASAVVVWVVAHLYARERVARLPGLGPALRPLLAAALGVGAWRLVAGEGWGAGLAAVLATYAGAARLLDPRLLRDLRGLVMPAGEASATPPGGRGGGG